MTHDAKPRLIIFDCDGVLIESEIIATEIEARALSEIGFEITADGVARRFSGRPSPEVYAAVEAELGRPLPDRFEAEVDRQIIAAYRDELKPVRGAFETIAALDVPICVASSSTPSKLFTGLIEAGLVDLFYPNIFSTVLVERGKPEPDLFLFAAERMGAPPEHCLVVEDSPFGVRAGKAAGMRVIGFSGGAHCREGHADRLREVGADCVIQRFEDLPGVIGATAAA